MKTRIRTAAILLPILAIVLWLLPKVVMAVLVALLAAVGSYELLISTGFVRHKRLMLYSAAAAVGVSMWSYFGTEQAWLTLGLAVYVGILFAEMMCNHVKVRFEKLCICLVAGFVLPYLLSALVRIQNTYTGRYTILIPFLLAILPDTGAYFVGRWFGRRKLAPVISPNKTVEGALGGLLAGLVGMLLYTVIMDLAFDRTVNYAYAIVYGLLGSGVGIFGDLMFSSVKRQAGIKDYGSLFPGHGGILDRFDSMMMVAPMTEVLLILLPVVK